MRIRAIVREVYGKKYTYITDQIIREAVQTISGRKTISKDDIAALSKLDIDVTIIDPSNKIEGSL